MPLTGTALKRCKINERNRRRNQAVRSELKTRIKGVDAALAAGDADTAATLLQLAMRRFDKAATKGIIHRNQAARRKSRLQRRYNAAIAPKSPE